VENSSGSWKETIALETGETVLIAAKDVRTAATGMHAHIGIMLDGKVCAHSVFNLGRDEERGKLVRSAHALFPSLAREALPAPEFKHRLDMFCLELAEQFHERFQVVETGPRRLERDARFPLRPFIVQGGGTILFAPPGSGKSWLTYLMAASVHFGIDTFWPVVKSPVLYVNLERSEESIRHRFAQLFPVLGLDSDRALPMLHARGQSLASVKDTATKAAKARGSRVVFLDSISRAGAGSLVKDDVANETVDALNAISPTWCAIGHTARDNGDHVFGSQHFDAGGDIMVKVASEHRDNLLGLSLEVSKANDLGPVKRQYLAFVFNGEDEDSELIAIRPARQGEFPELAAAGKPMSHLQRLEQYVMQVGKATTTQAAKETGIAAPHVSTVFTKSARFHVVAKNGREVFYGLTESLHP